MAQAHGSTPLDPSLFERADIRGAIEDPVIPKKRERMRPDAAARLERYREDVVAGAFGVTTLASLCNVHISTARRWLEQNGIELPETREVRRDVPAIDVFGDNPPNLPHPVVGRQRFTIPEYVLRVPLDYDGFGMCVSTLLAQGHSAAFVSRALGVREQDVETAALLWRAAAKRGR